MFERYNWNPKYQIINVEPKYFLLWGILSQYRTVSGLNKQHQQKLLNQTNYMTIILDSTIVDSNVQVRFQEGTFLLYFRSRIKAKIKLKPLFYRLIEHPCRSCELLPEHQECLIQTYLTITQYSPFQKYNGLSHSHMTLKPVLKYFWSSWLRLPRNVLWQPKLDF